MITWNIRPQKEGKLDVVIFWMNGALKVEAKEWLRLRVGGIGMKFKVWRASDPVSKQKPCDEAIHDSNGFHVIINSCKEMFEFIKNNGEIIMTTDTITIFDDYL